MRKRLSKKVYHCNKQTSKKYSTRSSPPYPANECPGKIKIGNDGQKYISVCSFETGIFKWVQYSKTIVEKKKQQLLQIKSKLRKSSKNKSSKNKSSKNKSKRRRSSYKT